MRSPFRSVLWLAALAALLPALAAADPPARVGRLSLIEGGVAFRSDRQDQGSAAAANWPVSSGALVDTDGDGRAEIRIGANAFRLAPDSGIEFTAVEDNRILVHLGHGSLAVSINDRDQAGDIQILTPGGEVRFGGPGRYRLDLEENGDTRVSSRRGSAHVYRGNGQLAIPAGRQGYVYAQGGWIVTDLEPDQFDTWADSRDAALEARHARRYVSPYMTGYEDLDRHGQWDTTPEYGTVWYPQAVPLDWAPYRYGRWAWVSPWGWTWVDDAPWGFAPFHYGRWLFLGGRWAWVPGTYVARPVYAPALVAWVGSPGGSAGFGFGSSPAVGWFPLAPREVFVPGYRCSPTYVRQVNVTHVHNVAVINRFVNSGQGHRGHRYANGSLPNAVTMVPVNAVRTGTPIGPDLVRTPGRHDLHKAPVHPRAPTESALPPAAGALRPHPGTAPFSPMLPPRREGGTSMLRSPAGSSPPGTTPTAADQRPGARERGERNLGKAGERPVMPPPPGEQPANAKAGKIWVEPRPIPRPHSVEQEDRDDQPAPRRPEVKRHPGAEENMAPAPVRPSRDSSPRHPLPAADEAANPLRGPGPDVEKAPPGHRLRGAGRHGPDADEPGSAPPMPQAVPRPMPAAPRTETAPPVAPRTVREAFPGAPMDLPRPREIAPGGRLEGGRPFPERAPEMHNPARPMPAPGAVPGGPAPVRQAPRENRGNPHDHGK